MANRIERTKASNISTILHDSKKKSCGIVVSDSDYVTESGRKIVKAGTPLEGDLTKRTTAFTKSTSEDAIGVLLHDVDVTDGSNNGELMYWGSVDVNKVDSTTAKLYTETIKDALKGAIWFIG